MELKLNKKENFDLKSNNEPIALVFDNSTAFPLDFDNGSFELQFNEPLSFELEAEKVVIKSDYPTYTGSYIVEPSSSPQTLATKDKVLANNVTVKKIPYSEVDNASGGTTLYIGKVN